MKKSGYLLLLFSAMVQAQIVNIPDSNFKARLLMANSSNASIAALMNPEGTAYIGGETIDTNYDGEIQISEAQRIDYLDVSTFTADPAYSISSITGIEAFTNLKFLRCTYNSITSLDVSELHQLQGLNCSDNLISNLDLSGLGNLKSLVCSGNLLTALDFSPTPNIESVGCGHNQIATLDFSNNPFFYDLGTGSNNALTSINLQNGRIQNTTMGIQQCDGFWGCPNLTSICADANEISNLQLMVSFFSSSQSIEIIECQLSNEDFASTAAITVYPNPARDMVSIESASTIKSMELFDVQGRRICTRLINDTKSSLNIAAYSKGIYILKIATENGNKIQKIIKE